MEDHINTAIARCILCTFTREQCNTCITYHSLATKNKLHAVAFANIDERPLSIFPPFLLCLVCGCAVRFAVPVAFKRRAKVLNRAGFPIHVSVKIRCRWPAPFQKPRHFPQFTPLPVLTPKRLTLSTAILTLSFVVQKTAMSSAYARSLTSASHSRNPLMCSFSIIFKHNVSMYRQKKVGLEGSPGVPTVPR